jgi:DNA-binding CsgD family transcriptional regulator
VIAGLKMETSQMREAAGTGPLLAFDDRMMAAGAVMAGDSETLALVSGIYDAALGEGAWTDVLARLVLLFEGSGATLRRASFSLRVGRIGADDAVALRWTEPGATGPRTEIVLYRRDGRPGWGEPEAALLRYLGPHLSRALQIDRRFADRLGPHDASPHDAPPAASRRLSPREQDCLAWVARGASSKFAARQLGLSSHTVDEHVRSAMAKLGTTTRAEAVTRALSQGLLRLPPTPAPEGDRRLAAVVA